LTSKIREILNELPKNREKVFHWSVGSKSSLNRQLDTAFSHCKIDKDSRSFHEFRKTRRYHLYRSNTPVDRAAKLMRHDINVMMKHYTEFNIEELTKYAENAE
jgi:integrase